MTLQRLRSIATRLDAVVVMVPGVEEGVALEGAPGVAPRPAETVLPVAEATTAGRRLRGFVVNPHWHPMVFRRRRRYAQQDAWDRFLDSQGVETADGLNALHAKGGTEYSVDSRTESPFYGVLRRAGRMLHDVDVALGAWAIDGGAPVSMLGSGLVQGASSGAEKLLGLLPQRANMPPVLLRGVYQVRDLLVLASRAMSGSWKGPVSGSVAIESAMGWTER